MVQRFRDRSAVFGWVFMAIWLAMLSAFTALFLRDGPPPDTSPQLMFAALAAFWILGLPAAAHIFSKPVIEVLVQHGGSVILRKRRLLRRTERRFGPRAQLRASLVEARDSDGDPYFHARLLASGETEVDLWSGHSREQAQAEVARFNAAVGEPTG